MKSKEETEDLRLIQLKQWLQTLPLAHADSLRPASNDASFRRYFRLDYAEGTAIVMDAPPDKEDCAPFVAVAAQLAEMGLNAPTVLEKHLPDGFLLLTDLGSELFLHALDDDSASRLYQNAIDALLIMHDQGAVVRGSLPSYSGRVLREEMALFHDWLCGRHLQLEFDAAAEAEWRGLNAVLTSSAYEQPRVFVHRDYHSRNLMLSDPNPGIIDFQDAMNGPLTYDLVSLLKDCYKRWPRERVLDWAQYYFSRTSLNVEWPVFLRWFDLMGVQRHLKAAGIFARLYLRDGKAGFMDDIPRTLSYILEIAPEYPELEWVSGWIQARVLPGLESKT